MPRLKAFVLNTLAALFCVLGALNPIGQLIARAYRLSSLRRASRFPVPASTQFDGPVRLVGSGNLVLGEYCRLGRNVLFETNGDAKILIGNHVRINDGTIITAHVGVSIGDNTLIGEYVSIRDANHGMAIDQKIHAQPHDAEEISIGQDVWIARGGCILKGVSIGDGAVVGANSVVTKGIDPYVISAGVPARKLGDRNQN